MLATPELHRFARRARSAVFATQLIEALAGLALLGAAGLLVARLFGLWPTASWVWLGVLVVPLAWAAFRTRARWVTTAHAAIHLDRHLGLHGLLVSGLELDHASWSQQIEARLKHAPAHLPRWRARPALVKLMPASAILGGVLLLPPPAAQAGPTTNAALQHATAEIEQKIELLREEHLLDEARGEQLATRLQALRERTEDGAVGAWNDADALNTELAAAQNQWLAQADQAVSALANLASAAQAAMADATSDPPIANDDLAGMLELAQALGLLDPEDSALRARLQAGAAPLPSAAELARLAAALKQELESRLQELVAAGVLDPAQAEQWAQQLALAEHAPMQPGHTHGPG